MARQKKRQQQDELTYVVFKDQHGRPWETTWNKVGLGTCGPTNPKGWSAPVLPPSHCLSEHEDNPKEFTINYSKWLQENREHQQRYKDEIRVWAQRMKLSVKDPDVIEMVGKPPMPEDLIRACEAGNKWALGVLPMGAVPQWAEPYRYVFENKAEMPRQSFPDVDAERYAVYEEAVDPEAVGGKKVTPKTHETPPKPHYAKTGKRDGKGRLMKAKSIADLESEMVGA